MTRTSRRLLTPIVGRPPLADASTQTHPCIVARHRPRRTPMSTTSSSAVVRQVLNVCKKYDNTSKRLRGRRRTRANRPPHSIRRAHERRAAQPRWRRCCPWDASPPRKTLDGSMEAMITPPRSRTSTCWRGACRAASLPRCLYTLGLALCFAATLYYGMEYHSRFPLLFHLVNRRG